MPTQNTIKGIIASAIAFVTCPCHLPITAPLLITLTAGTVFSAWLQQNMVVLMIVFTVIFISGVLLAFK